MMRLNLSSKTLANNVTYIHPHKEISVGDDFFTQELQKEVVNLSHSKRIQYQKICQLTLTTLGSTLILGTQAFAKEPKMADVPGMNPGDIIPYGIWAVVGMVVVGAFLAMLSWGTASMMKMMFRRKKAEATQWQKDIIRGYADLLAGPVIIGLLTMAAILFFGHFGWYIKPFQGL